MTMIVFTSCSVNYLPRAKTLADSLKQHEPNLRFIVCLVDALPPRDLALDFSGLELVPIDRVGLENLEDLTRRYDVVQLSTAVKPFFFRYLFGRFPECSRVIYLDPDTMVFSDLGSIRLALDNAEILLTPHILDATLDAVNPAESLALVYGLYNLGFLALKRGVNSFRFLDWWATRLRDNCRRLPHEGMFVDQLMVNLVPVLFEGVEVCRHRGMNLAYWNFGERTLTVDACRFFVDDEPLVFAHFSSYDPQRPELISKSRSCTTTFAERPDLTPLFEQYRMALLANGHEAMADFPCFYVAEQKRGRPGAALARAVLAFVKKLFPSTVRVKLLRALAEA